MIQTKKMETICLLPEKRDALCKALGVSKRTYYNAVNGVTNSALAEKIRREALEIYGGKKIRKEVIVGA